MKSSLHWLGLPLLLFGLSGATAPAQDVIKVGEFASLTGKEATFGQMSHNGTQMAIDEINAAGGLLGKKLQLVCEDTQSKAGEPATVVKKLISRDRVIAILGEVASSRSLEAAPICQQSRIPMISPSSTNPKVTETGDYIFRVCFIDPFQGTVMANFATKTLKIKNVALLTDVKSDYSMGLAKFFKEQFAANGGKLVSERDYSGGDKDFKAQLTAIKAAKPEGLFIPGYYTDVGLMLRQAQQLGLNIPIFGGDGWESTKLMEIGGRAAEGTYFSTHFSPEDKTPTVQNFVKNFKAKHKEAPDAMAALGYDSAMILADAIKRAKSFEPSAVREALAATKSFHGVTGTTTLDEKRNATKPAVINTIKNGRVKYMETVNP
jgi:branched-chain amino acid transport system substrate-binding protein